MKIDRERLRLGLLTATLLAGALVFLTVVQKHYPVQRWLVWRYLWYWALSLFWGLSCLSAGSFLLDRLKLRALLPEGEPLVLAFPLGVFAFHLAIFLLGLAGALGVAVFVALPVLFLASGLGGLRRTRIAWTGPSAREVPLLLFGVGALALIYAQVISPEAFSHDARWYHLPIAQQYAITGAVRPTPQGWWLAAYPHLASYLYTWAFLLPKSLLFDRLELCAHMEMVVFLGTLAAIPVLVRRFVPETSARFSWTAAFLFPSLFLYDGNLHGGADHIAALFTVPVFLVLLSLWSAWNVRLCGLFAVFIAALALTKYSAICILPFPLAAITLRALWLALKHRRDDLPAAGRPLRGLAVAAALTLVLTTPHWLKNWLWYGDPLYPALYRWLAVHPWNPDAAGSLQVAEDMLSKPRHGLPGLLDAAEVMFKFSFIPNDWKVFHRDVPIFGSLFTLMMFCLPFARASGRLWAGFAAAMTAIFFWYLPSHQDRYLQVVLPLMAACTVAMIVQLWRTRHRLVQLGVAALVVLQLAWGADVPFLPTHNLLVDSPLHAAMNLAATGFLRTPNRYRVYGVMGEIGEALPPDANVLIHETPMQLGIPTRTVEDQWQGALSYARLASPGAIQRKLASMGITHLLWTPDSASGWNCLACDLAFLNFAGNYGEQARRFGTFALARFPTAALPDTFNSRVAVMTCRPPYASGWYDVGDLTVPRSSKGGPAPSPSAPIPDLATAATQAGFMAIDPKCAPPLSDAAKAEFLPPAKVGPLQLYVRKTR